MLSPTNLSACLRPPRVPRLSGTGRRARLLAGVVALGVTGLLGACGSNGGNSGPTIPDVTVAGTGAGAAGSSVPTGPATTASQADVLTLYAKWAQCVRDKGLEIDDPQVGADGAIDISVTEADPKAFESADKACDAEHQAARTAARGGKPASKPDPAKALAFSKCMRDHGIASFPDPDANGGIQIKAEAGSELSPDNPTFQTAQEACQPLMDRPDGGGEKINVATNGGGADGGPSGGVSQG